MRVLALGVPAAEMSGARSPAELSELLLPGLLRQWGQPSPDRLLRANRLLAGDELHLLALHGQLLRSVTAREPDESNLAETLLGNEVQLLQTLIDNPE